MEFKDYEFIFTEEILLDELEGNTRLLGKVFAFLVDDFSNAQKLLSRNLEIAESLSKTDLDNEMRADTKKLVSKNRKISEEIMKIAKLYSNGYKSRAPRKTKTKKAKKEQ